MPADMQYEKKSFSQPTSLGKMTDLEYFIRVGAVEFCEKCKDYKSPGHECK